MGNIMTNTYGQDEDGFPGKDPSDPTRIESVDVKIIPALTPSESVGVVSMKYESQLKIW